MPRWGSGSEGGGSAVPSRSMRRIAVSPGVGGCLDLMLPAGGHRHAHGRRPGFGGRRAGEPWVASEPGGASPSPGQSPGHASVPDTACPWFVPGERVAHQPERGGPEPHEKGSPLGVAALSLVHRLGADPEHDAEADRSERGGLQVSGSQAGAMHETDEHQSSLTRSDAGLHWGGPIAPPVRLER
jgi:hypothetical protein